MAMKKSKLTAEMATLALAATLSYSLAVAGDDIGGGAKADFSTSKLTVPCVEIRNLSGSLANNKFFDIVLERRGSSFNFELTYAASEDAAMCQQLANIATFEDSNYSDDNTAPGENGFGILVRCNLRVGRSSVSVDARDLAAGTYIATIKSGTKVKTSLPMTISGDEVEFDFDSDNGDVAEGAVRIDTDFIQNDLKVVAEIVNDITDKVVYSATGICLVN